MKNKMLAIGLIVVVVIVAAVYLFYTQRVSPTVNQLTNQATSSLDQQLTQATSGISSQDVVNTVNSPA